MPGSITRRQQFRTNDRVKVQGPQRSVQTWVRRQRRQGRGEPPAKDSLKAWAFQIRQQTALMSDLVQTFGAVLGIAR